MDGEEFILAVDCADEPNMALMANWSTALVVTDRRDLALKKKRTNKSVESYNLDKISSVEYDKGLTKAEITIKGSGDIDEIFEDYGYKSLPERSVSALNEQLNSQ